ncbi:MAG: hypothetical protein ACC662_03530, partial [Planctomycetota bacterium]
WGHGWGLLGSAAPAWPEAYRALAWIVGGAALMLGAWGGVSAIRNASRGLQMQARGALVGALSYLVVAGSSALAIPASTGLRTAWILAPVCGLGLVAFAGVRVGLSRLLLDLVGVVRLLAVAFLALLIFDRALYLLTSPDLERLLMAPAMLLVAILSVVVDPAHVAMGVPYDLSLGGRGLGRPFEPLGRHRAQGSDRGGNS